MTDSGQANTIRERLLAVRQRMHAAAVRAGREPSEICLVAVSKTHGPEVVRLAAEAGQLVFGENRIEEASPKMLSLSGLAGLEWHMIGHVQSRKAPQVIAAGFALVHSVDTLKFAERLGRFASVAGREQPVLLEINISDEASKAGFRAGEQQHWPDLVPTLEPLFKVPGLRVDGLMTMAPQVERPELARPHFERLWQLREFLVERTPLRSDATLSMGMTDDFEVAIEAGATMVRIGRAIFGERD